MTQIASTTIEPYAENGEPGDFVNMKIVRWFFIASLMGLIFSMLAGMIFSLQFFGSYPFVAVEWMSPGRWRMVHTHSVIYGFIFNGLLGSIFWVVPRQTSRPVLCKKISWLIFYLWQIVVIVSITGLICGHAQAIHWSETPEYIDPVVQLVLLLLAVNFLPSMFSCEKKMGTSLLFIMTAMVYAIPAYALNHFLPQHNLGSTSSLETPGLFTNDLMGVMILPLSWGLILYFVPAVLNKSLWSHKLSLAGFWLYIVFYPLKGILLFFFGTDSGYQPYEQTMKIIVFDLLALTIIINFLGTIRGSFKQLRSDIATRWFTVGMFSFAVFCLLQTVEVSQEFQQMIQFSDWGVANLHLMMFGVIGFWILGFMTCLFPRLLGASDWYRPGFNALHFWCTTLGLFIMVIDLAYVGWIQGKMWDDILPWESALEFSMPFWILRTMIGTLLFVGLFPFFVNILMTGIFKRRMDTE